MIVLLAEFTKPDALMRAARQAQSAGDKVLDAFTPFPIAGMAELLGMRSTRLRAIMFAGGIAVALGALAAEYFSAMLDYPINSGGRPLNSWPAFMLFPFAIGIFAAAVSGFIALMADTGLPRLHHPLFAIEGFERASQSRFLLAIEVVHFETGPRDAEKRLRNAGALSVREVEA
ncbi:DUF3341 domain-containing protein [Gaiella sp.]|uniref:DUF3341 domain-containing protein n=1 Tax=Gaiella sp. TaxID=2663207 RepID=UPI002E2EC7C2|nr:DUF3341 domain-containing protein [Gaiella sp.]HEX5585593.1 DUF3341 domain-containing protein [Gaiella sp.]